MRLLASQSDSEFPDGVQGAAQIREEGHSIEDDAAEKSTGLLRMLRRAYLEGGHRKTFQNALVRLLQHPEESSNFVADCHFGNNAASLDLGVAVR
jgi:hypothetical protein